VGIVHRGETNMEKRFDWQKLLLRISSYV